MSNDSRNNIRDNPLARAGKIVLALVAMLCWFVCCQRIQRSLQSDKTPKQLALSGRSLLILRSTSKTTGQPIAARWTIVACVGADRRRGVFAIQKQRKDVAARPRQGILYTMGRSTPILLKPGRYTIYATRGMAWSLAQQTIVLSPNQRHQLTLQLQPEIDTRGYTSLDPHIHTLTYSEHGDIQVAERMVTIAGEALDAAVATDHNINVDYKPFQQKTGTTGIFRSFIGNEVGSLSNGHRGHINIYPIRKDAFVPHSEFATWAQLMPDIAQSKASFWTLNHPRWPLRRGLPSGPFHLFGLNRISGDLRHSAVGFPFQGIELINADTALTRRGKMPLYLFRDWFALLNHGERAAGVAGSDSHTVQVPVGQARTYVKVARSAPTKQLIDALRAGRSVMSMGIFITMHATIAPTKGAGETIPIPPQQKQLSLNVRIQATSWIRPRRLLLFHNGKLVASQKIPAQEGKTTDHRTTLALERPRHDGYLVAIALGDQITAPPWYHGELMRLEKYTIGATNPLYLDVDGNGRYDAPRTLAQQKLKLWGDGLQLSKLQQESPVVGVQIMSLLQARWRNDPGKQQQWQQWLRALSLKDALYRSYRRSLQRTSSP